MQRNRGNFSNRPPPERNGYRHGNRPPSGRNTRPFVSYAEKDKLERQAQEFFKFLKKRPNWTACTSKAEFQSLYSDFSRQSMGTLPFESAWPFVKTIVESWNFVGYLRKYKDTRYKATKEQLEAVYTTEYRPRIVERSLNTVSGAADFKQVLKVALFRGKLLELNGYIYAGDSESALAQALNEPPDPQELSRRLQKKSQRPCYCECCDVDCRNQQQYAEHMGGRRHKIQQVIRDLSNAVMKRELIRDKEDIRVQAEPRDLVEFDVASGSFSAAVELNERVEFTLRVVNDASTYANPFLQQPVSGGKVFVEEFLFFFKVDSVFFNDTGNGLVRKNQQVQLMPGESLTVQVVCLPQNFTGRSVVPIMFACRRDARKFRILRFVKVEYVRDKKLFSDLKPQTAFSGVGRVSRPSPLVVPPRPLIAASQNDLDNSSDESDFDNEKSAANLQKQLPPPIASKPILSPTASFLSPPPPKAAEPLSKTDVTTTNSTEEKPKGIFTRLVGWATGTQTQVRTQTLTLAQAQQQVSPPTLTQLQVPTQVQTQTPTLAQMQVSRSTLAQTQTSTQANTKMQVQSLVPPTHPQAMAAEVPAAPSAIRVASAAKMDAPGAKKVVRAPKLTRIRSAVINGLQLLPIDEHPISDKARALHKKAVQLGKTKGKLGTVADALLHTLLSQKVDETNLTNRFGMLLQFEELQMDADIALYAIEKAKLTVVREKNAVATYTLRVPGVTENRPCVLRGDILLVELSDRPDKVFEAAVENVEGELLRLRFDPSFTFFEGMNEATVHFQVDRLALRFQHEALNLIKDIFVPSSDGANRRLNVLTANVSGDAKEMMRDRLRALLFPTRIRYGALARHLKSVTLKPFFNRLLNDEQKRCVTNIVLGMHYPAPFLIFGPPGTGKTSTLSEAIKQVFNCFDDSFILVCAPENTSADHLVQTICRNSNIESRKVLRLYAASRVSSVPDFIAGTNYCTYDFMDDGYPTAATIQTFRIVITTLHTATRLVFCGFPRNHFTHLFIDEAGHAMEPEVFMPIAGLLSQKASTGGQLIMAGDPCQLGVTVRSAIALKYRLEISLLERLMNCDLYKVAKVDIQDTSLVESVSKRVDYDQRLLVKLRRNYRSHDAIIAFSRDRFYHRELDACADEMFKNAFIDWELLPNPDFPVIFHPVVGSDEREGSSPSYFNRHELMEIDRYLNALLKEKRGGIKVKPEDIGIISPYKGQNARIKKLLERYADVGKSAGTTRSDLGVMVGTVEEFQGQERTVIIISTVRSSEKLLNRDVEYQVGFIDHGNREHLNVCMKRINVALTRAKSLLIVIGNPFILELDLNWKKWLEYCDENRAWAISRPQIEKSRSAAMVNDVLIDDNEDETDVSRRELQEEPQWVRRE